MLAFQLAHARARDAVHRPLDVALLQAKLPSPTIVVDSAAPNREAYLQNPDLGRRLGAACEELPRGAFDLAIVVADGLSASAVHSHAPAVVNALRSQLGACGHCPSGARSDR